MKVLHDGSSRIYIPSRNVHQLSFQRCLSFFILHPEAILSSILLEVVLCHFDNLSSCFHDSHVVKNEIF